MLKFASEISIEILGFFIHEISELVSSFIKCDLHGRAYEFGKSFYFQNIETDIGVTKSHG